MSQLSRDEEFTSQEKKLTSIRTDKKQPRSITEWHEERMIRFLSTGIRDHRKFKNQPYSTKETIAWRLRIPRILKKNMTGWQTKHQSLSHRGTSATIRIMVELRKTQQHRVFGSYYPPSY